MRHGRDEQGGVGNAAGNDDVGSGFERGQQRCNAKICVRGNELAEIGERRVCLEGARSRIDFRQHVVAGDHRHANRNSLTACDSNDGVCRSQWIGGAHVGDQPEAACVELWQQKLDAPFEQRVVSSGRILALAKLRQSNRALSQALEDQVVDPASCGENDRRLEPVARESGTATDPQRFRHVDVSGFSRQEDSALRERRNPSRSRAWF